MVPFLTLWIMSICKLWKEILCFRDKMLVMLLNIPLVNCASSTSEKQRVCVSILSQTSFTQWCIGEVTTTLFLLCRGMQTVAGRSHNFLNSNVRYQWYTWEGCKGEAVLVQKLKSSCSHCGFYLLYFSEGQVAKNRCLVLSVNQSML